MKKIDSLYKNETIEVKTVRFKEIEKSFTFVQSINSSGDSVAILPFRLKKDDEGNDVAEFLVRRDWVPAWGVYEDALKQPYFLMTAISGDVLSSDTPLNVAVRILKEQTGYEIFKDQLVELGSVFLTKTYAGMCYVCSVDLTGLERGEESKDDELKKLGEAFWTDEKTMVEIGADPLIHVIFSKLLQRWT